MDYWNKNKLYWSIDWSNIMAMVLCLKRKKKIPKNGYIVIVFWYLFKLYSTVTDLAKFLGISTLQPRITAM